MVLCMYCLPTIPGFLFYYALISSHPRGLNPGNPGDLHKGVYKFPPPPIQDQYFSTKLPLSLPLS